ncbi:DEAD/DEAH box helicase family protein [Hyphomicrobium sp.]|uniref:DEAD/DEAH box helicase family protein n=1 Tax=Hyphomicrobium sp. TaxID=82 RepID=UPI003F6E8D51
MKVIDYRSPPPALRPYFDDTKEAFTDALLNLVRQRISGTGEEGRFVYGAKPSLRFVSGFLLPRYSEAGIDETSDIHICTHGIDCQIGATGAAPSVVTLSFSIYVRALPSWAEITAASNELFPNPPLKKDVESHIRDEMKPRLKSAMDAEGTKPENERKHRRDVQQLIYRELLAQYGVEISTDAWVADEEQEGEEKDAVEESPAASEEPTEERLIANRGRYKYKTDSAAQEIDVPQKWWRLPIVAEPLQIDVSSKEKFAAAVGEWVAKLRASVRKTVAAWIDSQEGADWAYRRATIKPSDFRNEAAWNAFLTEQRKTKPPVDELAPNMNGLSLLVQVEPDLRDQTRRNLRLMVENNNEAVGKRQRHRYEHAIHQVALELDLPTAIHRRLKLDRVEPSYRFRDFLTYPAIGINCGVSESQSGNRTKLMTTWMPRYNQPRLVPSSIAGVSMEFDALAAEHFDPSVLRKIVKSYRDWIANEKVTLDPARGSESAEEADRETEKFRDDLASYGREANRIELGIGLLEHSFKSFTSDPDSNEAAPYKAWRFLNRTFGDEGARRGIKGWRLFQLTFVLAHVPTISSRMHEYAKAPWFDPDFDEETATLLYFPTGGGKSEAFFGLLVFNLFLDRLRGKNLGVTALVRYPLRLLTLQQAQRLLSIVVRAEFVRRAAKLAGSPFEIGFWVGSGNTPNRPDDDRLEPVPDRADGKHKNDDRLGLDYESVNESFNKIPKCPVCDQATGLRRITTGGEPEIGIFCFNEKCEWNTKTDSSQLPLLIIDRDIYRHAPSILLGVIDKLALIGQHPATINRVMAMFGFARWRERATGRLVVPSRKMLKEGAAANSCEELAPAYKNGAEIFHDPFPSLIIQDEAHLLEESLGTFAGLFETMLEQLFKRAADLLGTRVARSPFGQKPPRLAKVVAATATVSVPQQQFGALYQRRHMHFPYPGPSIYRSFYAVPATAVNPGRANLGGNTAKAPEIEAPWMRVYASIMTNGKNHTVTTVNVLSAYHLAISELWSAIQDPATRQSAVDKLIASLTQATPLLGMHTRALSECAKDPDALASLLDLFRISLTYVTNKKGGDQVIDAFREEVAKFHKRYGQPLSQFHDDLISGGVDVAQIQSIMRKAEGGYGAGDDLPELDQSLRNIVATSAISHGVDVDKFNAMFFAGMPSDIAEFIQASSRVGRTHVGFCLLIPTPHARRDRYIVETHDVFNRFLERMIAPPAITRWAASAHDRVLTSLFQAWLSGWAEQKLFIDEPADQKSRAPVFETVSDVSKLVTSLLPGAAKDFMDFAVAAIGVDGRGSAHLGAAPHAEYYGGSIRDLAKRLTDEFRTQYGTTRLSDFWENSPVGQKPMTSLRDIDEAGRFIPALGFGRGPRGADDRELVKHALKVVRRQSGRVSELDDEEGEG